MSKVTTEVSPVLFWAPFEGTINKEPLFVQYNKYQAQTSTSSDANWYIETPANGVLMDNEVWIKWYLAIDDNSHFIRDAWQLADPDTSTVNAAIPQNSRNTTAFRCAANLQRMCQSIALDINGTVMTYEFSKYHDA